MTPKALSKIKRELLDLQRSPRGIARKEFERLAKRLGRKRVNRGKEPTYEREDDPALFPPLTIPAHREISTGTAKSIIDVLLSDVDQWELHFLNDDE